MRVKTVLVTTGLLAALLTGAGVAHADTQCRVNADGATWCVDMDTGRSWEAAPQGSSPDNPYCPANRNWKSVQCDD
jgi:hypothetical protein